MWVRQCAGWANVRAKQSHACDNSEIAKKNEPELGQASTYVNENQHSKKSRKQYSYKRKDKKRQKCSIRYGKRAYPKTAELNVSTAPRCDVGCQSYNVAVRNKICSVWMMSFDNIEVVTCMPQMILACNLQLLNIDP